jgi:membrane-associated phospholipid phosphatase
VIGTFGRILIGIHYPTDVLGGMAYGAVASLFAYLLGSIFNPVLVLFLNFTRKFYLS